jgi:hypothetical protein
MYETQTIAAQALRELLDDSDRDDWDELLAAIPTVIASPNSAFSQKMRTSQSASSSDFGATIWMRSEPRTC